MSDIKKDGGPVFPRPFGSYFKLGPGKYNEPQSGMTLRDWFAGMALQQELRRLCDMAAMDTVEFDKALQRKIATASYNTADAMLAEREK